MYDLYHLPKHVTKYTFNVSYTGNFILSDDLTITYQSISNQISFEQPSKDSYLKIYKRNTKYDDLFDKLVGRYCYPFCRKDSEKMVLKSITPSNMNLTELNFKHATCYSDLLITIRKIFLSDCTKLVKKLAINFCLCEQSITSRDENYQPLFKKMRLGVPNKGFTKSIFEEVVDHMTLLEVLEIWECRSTEKTKRVTNDSLRCIENIKGLQNLTLQNLPVHVDGKFLIPIAQNCKKLRSLKLQSTRNLNLALCSALKYMTNLKDLLFKQADVNLQELFETLVTNNNLKLNRICFKFDGMNFDDMSILDRFLTTNDQLIFLGLIFQVSNSKRKLFNKIFQKYKLPKRVFLLRNGVSPQELRFPLVHVNEMVNYSTEVSVLNIYDLTS